MNTLDTKMKNQNQTNQCQEACIKFQRIPVFRKIRTKYILMVIMMKKKAENKETETASH